MKANDDCDDGDDNDGGEDDNAVANDEITTMSLRHQGNNDDGSR